MMDFAASDYSCPGLGARTTGITGRIRHHVDYSCPGLGARTTARLPKIIAPRIIAVLD